MLLVNPTDKTLRFDDGKWDFTFAPKAFVEVPDECVVHMKLQGFPVKRAKSPEPKPQG